MIAAGLVGFFSSFGLLRMGLVNMPLRYSVSVTIAYVAFVVLLRGVVGLLAWRMDREALFGRANRRQSRRANTVDALDIDSEISIPDVPGDEGCLVLLIPLAIAAALMAGAVYVVYIAPVLLAELIVDALLVSSIVRRLDRIELEGWYSSALRLTYKPYLIVLVTVAIASACAHFAVPEADSIGDLLRRTRTVESGIAARDD